MKINLKKPKSFTPVIKSSLGFTLTPISQKENLKYFGQKKCFCDLDLKKYTLCEIGVSSQSERGFTLIELLVVISIIALLSSVILAGLSSARNKADDSSVKAGMKQLMTQATLYSNGTSQIYSTDANITPKPCMYSFPAGTLFGDPQMKAILTNILFNSANSGSNLAMCVQNLKSFAIYVPLKGGGSWCVDSSNSSKNSSGLNAPNPSDPNTIWYCQ